MPTSAWTRRSDPTFPAAGPGGPPEEGRHRRWPWIVPAAGLLLATGAVAVALGPKPDAAWQSGGQASTGTVPVPATLPFDVLAPAGSTAGAVGGQPGRGVSVVTPAAGGPVTPAPATPVAAGLFLDPATVRGAEVRLAVGEGGFGAAFDRAASVATTFGGFVASSTSLIDEKGSSGQLVLRVPVANFDAARRAVAGLGDVEGETIRGQDVGSQLLDHEARQRTLEVQEEALRALVGKANTVGEVLQIQPALTSVRQQIEQLRGQRANLEDAAALSSILVTLREPGAATVQRHPDAPQADGLGRRFDQAVDGALAVAGGALVVLGWATPALVLAGAVWVVFAARRRRGRR